MRACLHVLFACSRVCGTMHACMYVCVSVCMHVMYCEYIHVCAYVM